MIYSPNPDDQMRFDNYDDRWDLNYSTLKGGDSLITKRVSSFTDNCLKIFRRITLGLILSPEA
ncbi:MAG: hypothetical protein ACTSRI_14605 [Promethearchaeota archaeon]